MKRGRGRGARRTEGAREKVALIEFLVCLAQMQSLVGLSQLASLFVIGRRGSLGLRHQWPRLQRAQRSASVTRAQTQTYTDTSMCRGPLRALTQGIYAPSEPPTRRPTNMRRNEY